MVRCSLFLTEVDGLLAFNETDEISRDHPALMNKLVEAVLAIRTRFTEVYFAHFERNNPATEENHTKIFKMYSLVQLSNVLAIKCNSFAVGFHVYLLNMSSKSD